jgi:hypothetical protein
LRHQAFICITLENKWSSKSVEKIFLRNSPRAFQAMTAHLLDVVTLPHGTYPLNDRGLFIPDSDAESIFLP